MNATRYISLEAAMILKEKGYKEPCECFYKIHRHDNAYKDEECLRVALDFPFINREEDKERFAAPKLEDIRKWLAFNHDIYTGIYEENYGASKLYRYRILSIYSDTDYIVEEPKEYYKSFWAAYKEGMTRAIKKIRL